MDIFLTTFLKNSMYCETEQHFNRTAHASEKNNPTASQNKGHNKMYHNNRVIKLASGQFTTTFRGDRHEKVDFVKQLENVHADEAQLILNSEMHSHAIAETSLEQGTIPEKHIEVPASTPVTNKRR